MADQGEENSREKSSSELEETEIADDTEMEDVSSDKDTNKEETQQKFEFSKGFFRHFCLTRVLTMNIYWRTLLLFAITMIYILVGGGMFSAAERPNEIRQNQAMEEANQTYFERLTEVVELLANNSNLTTEQATAIVQGVGAAAINASSISVSNNWLYGSAVFFATTIVTTIGYGSIAPVTVAGRALFIPYAIVGIPIALIFLTQLGVILNKLFEFATKPIHKQMEKFWVKILVLLIGSMLGLVAFIFIPAVIFSAIDGWTYFESIYFSFVSLTTVGFGDFVPSAPSSSNNIYRLCLSGWIFFGLAFIALVITQVQEYLMGTSDRLKECRSKVSKRIMKRNEKETA